MAEIKKFKTLVKTNDETEANEYVLGRITGIMRALQWCYDNLKGDFSIYTIRRCAVCGCHTCIAECSDETYRKFVEIVEELYPNLCIFYYEG